MRTSAEYVEDYECVVGVDGDKWYILWGENLQDGHSYFARTIGEIRDYHKLRTDLPLNVGNNWIDTLIGNDKTPADIEELGMWGKIEGLR